MNKELREKVQTYFSASDKWGDWFAHLNNYDRSKILAFIENEIIEAERRGIATCTNLIPETKEIVPLWGDNKYYAWYNAWIQVTRDNFDKYFNSL